MKDTARERANRRNARRSTGPRSAVGKRRVAQNAIKHGLATSILTNDVFSQEIETLARAIAGRGTRGPRLDLARAIAAAQADLRRIRQVRLQLLERHLKRGDYLEDKQLSVAVLKAMKRSRSSEDFTDRALRMMPKIKPSDPDNTAAVLADFSKELEVIDRYERRAASRLLSALAKFDLFRADSSSHVV